MESSVIENPQAQATHQFFKTVLLHTKQCSLRFNIAFAAIFKVLHQIQAAWAGCVRQAQQLRLTQDGWPANPRKEVCYIVVIIWEKHKPQKSHIRLPKHRFNIKDFPFWWTFGKAQYLWQSQRSYFPSLFTLEYNPEIASQRQPDPLQFKRHQIIFWLKLC